MKTLQILRWTWKTIWSEITRKVTTLQEWDKCQLLVYLHADQSDPYFKTTVVYA